MHRFRRYEKIAHIHNWKIAIISALALSLGCTPSQGDKSPGGNDRHVPEEAVTIKSSAPDKMIFEGPGKVVPKQVGDWKIAGPPRYFGPDNLYELINGGAEVYVSYGLKKMVTADFKGTNSDQTITVEAYDQGSVLGAFGRFSRFLGDLIDPSAVGKGLSSSLADRGMMGDGDILFWKGTVLVHLTLMDESATATAESITKAGLEILPKFAQAIAKKIDDESPIPPKLSKFPTKNKIPRTEAWTPKKTAGIQTLGAGFTTRYKDGNHFWTAFVTVAKDEKEASAMMETLEDKTMGAVVGRHLVGIVSHDETKYDHGPMLESLKKAFSK